MIIDTTSIASSCIVCDGRIRQIRCAGLINTAGVRSLVAGYSAIGDVQRTTAIDTAAIIRSRLIAGYSAIGDVQRTIIVSNTATAVASHEEAATTTHLIIRDNAVVNV